jgi:hypothetical protein
MKDYLNVFKLIIMANKSKEIIFFSTPSMDHYLSLGYFTSPRLNVIIFYNCAFKPKYCAQAILLMSTEMFLKSNKS